MRHAAVAVAVLIAAPAVAQDAYTPVQLTAAQATADVALLRRAMETIHPGLYRYRTRAEVDASFRALAASAARPTTDLALWRAVAEMVAGIHCDHSKAESSQAIERWRDRHATMLPFRFQMIEGRMIVVSNDGQPGAPPRGAEIISLQGSPAPLALNALANAVSYDGSTDQAVPVKLSGDSDLTGDNLNEFWPAYHGFPTRWAIGWKMPGDGTSHTADLTPIDFARWTTLAWPGESYRNEFYRSMTWRLAGKAAYLRIDTFVNYRNPVDATAMLGGFFRTLRERGTQHLILDLRNNGGGSVDVSVALARYILPRPFLWSKPVRYRAIRYGDLPEHIDSWGDRAALFEPPLENFRRTADGWWDRIPRPDNPDDESAIVQQPSPDRFTGRLTLLGGPGNASGSTRTIAQFHEAGARLVGEDTGGSAEGPTSGNVFLLTLPNSGLRVRIASAWNRSTVERFAHGRGVAADVAVLPTLADFTAGRDRALDVAKAEGTAPAAPVLTEMLEGRWRGTLEYRDFGSDRRVVLPLTAAATSRTDGIDLDETIDDGPGKTVRQRVRLELDGRGRLSLDGQPFDVIERRASADRRVMTVVAAGSGRENGRAVDVRMWLVRDGDRLTITRSTRQGAAPFVLRHGYTLARVG